MLKVTSFYFFSYCSLTRLHSRKRPALVTTTFSNSRGGRLRELRLYSYRKLIVKSVTQQSRTVRMIFFCHFCLGTDSVLSALYTTEPIASRWFYSPSTYRHRHKTHLLERATTLRSPDEGPTHSGRNRLPRYQPCCQNDSWN